MKKFVKFTIEFQDDCDLSVYIIFIIFYTCVKVWNLYDKNWQNIWEKCIISQINFIKQCWVAKMITDETIKYICFDQRSGRSL